MEAEVQKLINVASFERNNTQIRSQMLCPFLKRIWVCINFRDLNTVGPKDEFLLLITDVMIDNICGFERMSFIDGFLGDNQIKMYPDDEKHTSFRTSW